ncbi:MAG: hypothetical protein WKF94_11530 [Solirubrobacteraceae bacterium]
MVTVLLALSSAACYGVSNFVGPLLARREALFVVLFVSHVAALAGATVYLAFDGGALLGPKPFALAMLAGLGNGRSASFSPRCRRRPRTAGVRGRSSTRASRCSWSSSCGPVASFARCG